MINVAKLAQGAIQSILPDRSATLKKWNGAAKNADGERVATFTSSTIKCQIQDLSSNQLSYANSIGLQGELRNVYSLAPNLLVAQSQGGSGGDMLNFDGKDWLVVSLLESYPTYCKVIVQRQS
jgi:hypothetical protein